jgi:hypothetical protein
MTKSDMLYRAGYKAAQTVEGLSPSHKQLDGEHWNDRNARLETIERAYCMGWDFIRYATRSKDTPTKERQYNRGFYDRIFGRGYSLDN